MTFIKCHSGTDEKKKTVEFKKTLNNHLRSQIVKNTMFYIEYSPFENFWSMLRIHSKCVFGKKAFVLAYAKQKY